MFPASSISKDVGIAIGRYFIFQGKGMAIPNIYPNHLKIQDCASRKRVSTKALIERNGCSIVKINNAGDDPLSTCPTGAKLENQCSVAYMDVCT